VEDLEVRLNWKLLTCVIPVGTHCRILLEVSSEKFEVSSQNLEASLKFLQINPSNEHEAQKESLVFEFQHPIRAETSNDFYRT
jgi:hypothetical protein